MNTLQIQVTMQVLKLIFYQDMGKGTGIYIRGYEENAGHMERASVFGCIFIYPRKIIEEKRGGSAH